MLFDADVLIWALRGDERAAAAIDRAGDRAISVVTLMEVMAGVRDKREARAAKESLAEAGFAIIPLGENTGNRALIYIEMYALSNGISAVDALVAATAVENNLPLCTANDKHFKPVSGLDLVVFRP